jgi:hypothetical protein
VDGTVVDGSGAGDGGYDVGPGTCSRGTGSGTVRRLGSGSARGSGGMPGSPPLGGATAELSSGVVAAGAADVSAARVPDVEWGWSPHAATALRTAKPTKYPAAVSATAGSRATPACIDQQ